MHVCLHWSSCLCLSALGSPSLPSAHCPREGMRQAEHQSLQTFLVFVLQVPEWGRSPGEGNGTPLQYSCLGNPMDRGAWWAAAHGVTKRWTRPKRLRTQHTQKSKVRANPKAFKAAARGEFKGMISGSMFHLAIPKWSFVEFR